MNTPQNPYPCGNCLHIYATPDVAPCADCREDLTAQPVRFTGFVDWRTEVEHQRAELAALRARERACPTATEAEARALMRALQAIAAHVGLGIEASPADVVAGVEKLAAPRAQWCQCEPTRCDGCAGCRWAAMGVIGPVPAAAPRQADDETAGRRVRIAYRVRSHAGHGDWHAPKHRDPMLLQIEALNRQHGAGTHWIEYETPPSTPEKRTDWSAA